MSQKIKRKTLFKLVLRFIKKYRKNTAAILFSIILALSLIVSMLILLHTNHRITAKQNLFIYTAMDYEIKDLTNQQVKQLENKDTIQHLGLHAYLGYIETKDKQQAALLAANEDDILAVSTLLKGRMPQHQNEIVAEKWALLNLGLNPMVGQTFTLPTNFLKEHSEFKNETFTLVGIINDQAFNKRAGAVNLYTSLEIDQMPQNLVTAAITFKNIDKEKQIAAIQKDLSLSNNQIQKNVWQENSANLFWLDVAMSTLLISICSLVIYGVYRISLMGRQDQYGILRALGLTKAQVRNMILTELSFLTFLSFPFGVTLGFLISLTVTHFSKDRAIEIYFWGKADTFDLVIPALPILLALLALMVMIIFIGMIGSKKINDGSITETIFGNEPNQGLSLNVIPIKGKQKFLKTCHMLGLKYVFRDIKTSLFIVLSITFACTLFIGLSYQALLAKENQEIRVATSFYNSDFLMSSYDDMTIHSGIKTTTLNDVKKITGIESIEVQSALPVKVIDAGVERNKKYFEKQSRNVKRVYGFTAEGTDKEHELYHTKLKGYNTLALRKLQSYLLEGTFNPDKIEQDEVIIAMPTTSRSGKSKGTVGFFKQGQLLMDYRVDDTIKVKYRSDLNTADEKYWQMTDDSANYFEKNLKIIAIVYYPYMPLVSMLEQTYPILITSENHFKKIVPSPTYETVNLTLKKETSASQQKKIEERLIELAVENQQATARSLISEKEQLTSIYRKEMVYVIGISIVGLLLVITNLINNLAYRIKTRKKELYLLKALGMTFSELRKMIVFENIFFSLVSWLLALLISIPVTTAQYYYSEIYLLGKMYYYPLTQMLLLAVITVALCTVISWKLAADLQSTTIMEEFSNIE